MKSTSPKSNKFYIRNKHGSYKPRFAHLPFRQVHLESRILKPKYSAPVSQRNTKTPGTYKNRNLKKSSKFLDFAKSFKNLNFSTLTPPNNNSIFRHPSCKETRDDMRAVRQGI